MLRAFARLVGIRADQAEDALRSERAARIVLGRRDFFGVGAALTLGSAFSFAPVRATVLERPLPTPVGRGIGEYFQGCPGVGEYFEQLGARHGG